MTTRPHDDLTGWTETPGARWRHLTRALPDGSVATARQGADGLWRVSCTAARVGIGPGRETLTEAVEAAGLDLEVMADDDPHPTALAKAMGWRAVEVPRG